MEVCTLSWKRGMFELQFRFGLHRLIDILINHSTKSITYRQFRDFIYLFISTARKPQRKTNYSTKQIVSKNVDLILQD